MKTKIETTRREFPTVHGHPDYKAAEARRYELVLQHKKLEDEIADRDGRRRKQAEIIDAHAAALLDGTPPAVATAVVAESEAVISLQRDEAVAKRAIRLVDERLGQLKSRLSKDAVESLRPIHAELVRKTAIALAELLECNRELIEFDGRMVNEGIERGNLPLLHVFIPTQGDVCSDPKTPWFLAQARLLGLAE